MVLTSNVLACSLAICQMCSCPVNTLTLRTLQNSSKCPQYPAQSPGITSLMKSLWNELMNNNGKQFPPPPKKTVILIEGHSTNKLVLLCENVSVMKIKEGLRNYFK